MNTEYRKLKNLFLRQSCQDAWEDYARSIRKVNFPRWDYVILTSSNEEQARSFRSQIADRLEQSVLPGWTKYFVLPDPEGKRVGSGGATLNVLRFLSEEEGLRGDFHNKRILVIHSGGDSKRVPQYSVCGKLFSPVPRELPDGRGSTLFDEFLISMAGVPARFKEGMLVLSGDVLLLFNPLQIDAQFRGAAAISMKSPVEVGVDHGVFLNDGSDHVKMFLHKQPAETLRRLGAVNGQDCVDLDTGAVLLDAEILETLFSLIADASGKKADPDKYESFVNEKARVSFYGDFLYPLAADSTFEQYQKEKPEGEFCTELFICREKIWKALSPFQMKLICLSPAEFIHFGTTRELRALMTEEVTDYEFLDWKKHVFTNDLNCRGALHTALIGPEADIEEGTYIEDTCLEGRTHVGKGAVVSGLSLKDVHIPANTVFHGVKLKDEITELYGGQTGRCVIRTYGVMDNPKKTLEERGSFLRGNLADFLSANGLAPEDIWTGETHALWNATVLNAAILLRGCEPIEVEIRKIPELHIELASTDTGAYGTAESAEEIQDCHNPYDPFALHKAAIIACGILPLEEKADLKKVLEKMGGGFYLSTCVKGVPKGSGLGTSSILAGACVKAFAEFLGENWDDSQIYDTVLNLEQIMSTGGGWQDQVGGLTPGIKFITSRPGIRQQLKVEKVEISEKTKQELQERFALIYTGQRRLARNLLREVVGNYIGGRKESLEALDEMQKVAALMKFALEKEDIDEFASLLNQHWEISKKLDAGSTNTCIDQIFSVCEDMIDGKFISGAGGGGFLQVILKKGVTQEMLHQRLRDVFQDSGVDVWSVEFV